MNLVKGIIISGKVYEATEKQNGNPCMDCALSDDCNNIIDYCSSIGLHNCFRFSQELTDKLNSK